MIPSKDENPNGFHQKYRITKLDGSPLDEGAEYFLLRLDSGGDQAHVDASWSAIEMYAVKIQRALPQLSEDLTRRYFDWLDKRYDEKGE